MTKSLTCIDLFAGAGGFSLGFREAGFNIAAAIDRSESALETYSHNFGDINTVEADMKKVSPEVLVERAAINPSDIDIVIGGPPCKGFSTAGKMDPDNPKNSLVANYINIVSYIDPEIVVMENVKGILSMRDGEYRDRIVRAFRSEGYEIPSKPCVLNAADYGAPQHRERVFFLASKSGRVDPPSPTHYNPATDPEEVPDSAAEPWVTTEDAIGDLAFLRYGEEADDYKLAPLTEYQEEMQRDSNEGLANHKATNHTERVRERFKQLSPGETGEDLPAEYQTKKHSLQRWDPLEPAPTVTTLPDDFVHYQWPRIPTVRELARLQSFPDKFEFKGPRTTGGKRRKDTVPQYSQVGNAVPPRLAKQIGIAVKQQHQIVAVS
ncbi:DNA cytosine methyltransferase [Haloarcula sebkhae]|uniref:DNA (cytosine-5-)-methyltransferase n=2 Tax=Haloarcula sebkhae TaxID=932660 RepID=A0A830EXI1_9EURY|nr:DNA cytosine methyltransferase [Haloarcula sebkhae]GGK64737.1 cytosine-specific methyltransferase [Haloarcula sebkhae]